MRGCGIFVGIILLALSSPYVAETEKWRSERETKLKAPDGWLSVAGLFWLHEGANVVGSDPQSDVVLPASAPKRAGVLDFRSGQVRYQPASGSAENSRTASSFLGSRSNRSGLDSALSISITAATWLAV